MQPRPLYQLFYLQPPQHHAHMGDLVSAMWRKLFPGKSFGQNHGLDQIFHTVPELAILQLCPYYFDQVTDSLPTKLQQESCNLRLHCFDSWADLRLDMERAHDRKCRQYLRAKAEAMPRTGIYLTHLCHIQDEITGWSLSAQQYINLMYGFSC